MSDTDTGKNDPADISSSSGSDLGPKRRLQPQWKRDPDLSLSLSDRLTVEIEDDSDEDDEIKNEVQDFSWELFSASQNGL